MLELPTLDRIPRAYASRKADPIAAGAALALMDLGVVPPAAPSTEAPILIRLGLKRWLDERARGVRHINLSFHAQTFNTTARPPKRAGMTLELCSHNGPVVYIGKTLTALRRQHWQLAGMALQALDRVCGLLPILTPTQALGMASWYYWGGTANENGLRDEYRQNGENPDDLALLTRAEFDAAIPPWSVKPSPAICTDWLQHLAGRRTNTLPRRIARATLALVEALAHRNRVRLAGMDDIDTICLPMALHLHWSRRHDLMMRIYDDWGNDLAESGEDHEHLARIEILSGDDFTAETRGFLEGLEALFPVIRAVDELAHCLKGES